MDLVQVKGVRREDTAQERLHTRSHMGAQASGCLSQRANTVAPSSTGKQLVSLRRLSAPRASSKQCAAPHAVAQQLTYSHCYSFHVCLLHTAAAIYQGPPATDSHCQVPTPAYYPQPPLSTHACQPPTATAICPRLLTTHSHCYPPTPASY